MGYFKDWLLLFVENGNNVKNIGIINLVAGECDNSYVALKGSNVYPVTYSTLANVRKYVTSISFSKNFRL